MKWRPMTSPSSTYVLHILSFHAIGTLTLHWCGRNILLYIYTEQHIGKKVAKLLPFSSWYYACVAWAAKRGT